MERWTVFCDHERSSCAARGKSKVDGAGRVLLILMLTILFYNSSFLSFTVPSDIDPRNFRSNVFLLLK